MFNELRTMVVIAGDLLLQLAHKLSEEKIEKSEIT